MISPKIRKTKLKENPLFIKFLNWQYDIDYIKDILLKLQIKNETDKKIIINRSNNLDDNYLKNLNDFHKLFKSFVEESISTKTVSDIFLKFLSNTYKYIEEKIEVYVKDEYREIYIKDENGRWFESFICYNFIMTFNFFGIEIIKKCPICQSFFAHKGKWAKYCHDSCKEVGMKK